MSQFARIALTCEGDAETYDKAFSGLAKSLLDQLRAIGHTVVTINVRLEGLSRAVIAARSFAFDRNRWRAQFKRGAAGFDARTRRAERLLASVTPPVDFVLQIGASQRPPQSGITPYGLYCDWNTALSIRQKHLPDSTVHHLSDAAARAYDERGRAVYRDAAVIFSFSDVVRRSFIEDYSIPPDQVLTVYAGPNIDPFGIPPRTRTRPAGHRPTVLFIGKEFRRKGGEVLMTAFRRVRSQMPNARLQIIGPIEHLEVEEGVENLGRLSKDDPAQNRRLLAAYDEADVFCLPSRLDPFPTVVREAMCYSLPCVTTNIWALPEMVLDGETGFLVPPDDVDALAGRLLRVLRDPDLGRRLGEAGRQRVQQHFTFGATARKMSDRIQAIVESRQPTVAHAGDARCCTEP
ncbi:MAG TPA: glycosyltransferase family 4 protein [Fimbriiglobus sp.]|nr:glycosyltransferase family 4 protein [Fimbriiglobus sp.]